MSIDLTGNTNFAALKNLQDEVIVPRTSLAAVDMVTANGIERNGNVLKVKEAAAADMLSGSTTGAVVTADNLKKALAMGQATLLDMHTHELTASGGAVEWSFNGNQLDVSGTATAATAGIVLLGPIEGPATKNGKYLVTFDVFLPSTSTATNFVVSGPTFVTVGTYPTTVTTKGAWARCAGVINTTSTLYTGDLNLRLTTSVNNRVDFSVANFRLLDVTGFSDADILYLAGTGTKNTTVSGQTVIGEGDSQYLYKPGYGIKIKGDTIEIDTSVLAVDADDFIYGIDMDTQWADATSARIGGGLRRVIMDRSNGIISEVADFDYMPAHDAWRRCVMDNLETKHVNYYLDKNDSNLKEDHTPAVLTGADGDVMVEWPITYVRVDQYTDSNGHAHQRWLVSLTEFDGSRPHDCFYVSGDGKTVGVQYVGAFRMGGCNTNMQPVGTDENSWTVVTTGSGVAQAYYGRSIAGVKPIANTTIQQFRTIADNNGGHIISSAHAQFLGLMMLIEYGTDIQFAFNNGFASSVGLGWGQYRLCGRTASFGNNSTPATAVHANSIYGADTDDGAGFYRPTFATASSYSNSTYALRRADKDVNVGLLSYGGVDYKRDASQDVGYQVIIGGVTYDRGTPFENESEGIMYYKWTNGTTNYYTTDHSPTTSSTLYSDIFGDVSSATIEGDTDLHAWYNASATPAVIYTTVAEPNVGTVTVVDYDDTTLGTGTKGLDAYAWCPDKATNSVLYSAVGHPAVGASLYSDSTLTTAAVTITSIAGSTDPRVAIIQCSYRGIEDPFGSQWCFEDGAWGVFSMVYNGKTYYRLGGTGSSITVSGTNYYKWATDIDGQLGVSGADVVYLNTLTPTAGGNVYNASGTVIGTITSVTAPSCGAFWMTTSTDAYAVVTAIAVSSVFYWRDSADDAVVNNTRYYGWKSDSGNIVYSTTRQIAANGAVYSISGTTVTSAGTASAVYNAHQTYLKNYSLITGSVSTVNGYVRKMEPHTFVPMVTGSPASDRQWWCDYFYNVNAETGSYPNPRVVIRGGALLNVGYAGPFSLSLNSGFSVAHWSYGSRLAV